MTKGGDPVFQGSGGVPTTGNGPAGGAYRGRHRPARGRELHIVTAYDAKAVKVQDLPVASALDGLIPPRPPPPSRDQRQRRSRVDDHGQPSEAIIQLPNRSASRSTTGSLQRPGVRRRAPVASPTVSPTLPPVQSSSPTPSALRPWQTGGGRDSTDRAGPKDWLSTRVGRQQGPCWIRLQRGTSPHARPVQLFAAAFSYISPSTGIFHAVLTWTHHRSAASSSGACRITVCCRVSSS